MSNYLYAASSPVNFIDPSGKYWIWAWKGTAAHTAIGIDYKAYNLIAGSEVRLSNREITTILRYRTEITGTTYSLTNKLRPDLVDIVEQEIYEIKSEREGVVAAQRELRLPPRLYIPTLNSVDTGWHEGSLYYPTPELSTIFGIIQVRKAANGVILYKYINDDDKNPDTVNATSREDEDANRSIRNAVYSMILITAASTAAILASQIAIASFARI